MTINYAANQSQCCLRLPAEWLTGTKWQLRDLLTDSEYTRSIADLREHDLFLDQDPWPPCILSVVDGESA